MTRPGWATVAGILFVAWAPGLLSATETTNMEPGTTAVEYQTLFEPHKRGEWQIRYRIPNLLVSRKGTVFAFPNEKVDRISDEAKSNLVMRRSFDHGKTWRELEIVRTDENPRVRFGFSSGVADLETGRVLVLCGVGVVILPEDIGGAWPEKWVNENPDKAATLRKKLAPHIEPGVYLMWTDDEGETWSEPQPLGDALHLVHPLTGEKRRFGAQWVGAQLRYGPHKGRLVLPGRGFMKDKPFDLSAYAHNYVVHSDDHGRTWHAGGLTQTGTGEACLVETTDGGLYVNSRNESLRCRGYRAWDRSRDGGQTFTESGYDLNLPEAHCQASMARYSGPPGDRSRVLFCNPAVHSETKTHYDIEGRRKLTVRVSYDECRTWPVGRVVCEGGAGYSALAVCKDKTILCAYETIDKVGGKKDYTGSIVLARFSLDWLTERKPEPKMDTPAPQPAPRASTPNAKAHPLRHIDTSFENASPLSWEVDADGIVQVQLVYDQERSAPNRANGHWLFRVEAEPGAELTLVLGPFANIWNGKPAKPVPEAKISFVSDDGKTWRAVDVEPLEPHRIRLRVRMKGESLHVARLQPYRLSDLEKLKTDIAGGPLVEIKPIGRTVEGRELEIIRVGRPDAPVRILLRARSHPWEPGGNWVIEGLLRRLLRDDDVARRYLERYCVYAMPVSNKDGVARGRTRFNMRGMDLNRKWDQPADSELAPENAALEKWLGEAVAAGRRPDLMIDFHNDAGGLLHISRPEMEAAALETYLARMERFEQLLRKHTWFTEGSTKSSFRNPGSIGEGLLARYGIPAVVQELNANWIAGLKDYPTAEHWKKYGEQLGEVFYFYFEKP